MNIMMTGGTGFIGSKLVQKLVTEGHHVYVLTRYSKKYQDTEFVSYIRYDFPVRRLPFIHAMVNLAGESLFGYWTERKKTAIILSRIQATEKLIHMLKQTEKMPKVFLSGSAVGYYGVSDEEIFTESTDQPSDDFLGNVTSTWEQTAKIVEDFGIRTVYARFGVVLDQKQGALPLMALPIKLFVGGKIGYGEQWISWIHIKDCVRLLYFLLTESAIEGAVNVTAPYPQRNKEFTDTLATTLQRPNYFHIPTSFLQFALGEMNQLITRGQYVLPQKALDKKFTFTYPYLE